MNELMEITREEYLELVNKIDSLQATLSNATDQPFSLGDMIAEKPIEHVRPMDDASIPPTFEFSRKLIGDAWKCFRELARLVNTDSPVFQVRRNINSYSGRYFVGFAGGFPKPPTTKQMTPQQKDISAQMLNEMIPIYNKYYKMLHSEVLYTNVDGVCSKKEVIDLDDMKKGANI